MIKKVGAKLTADTTDFERGFKRAQDVASKAGRTLVAGFAVVSTAAAALGAKSLLLASEMEETQGKFDVVFRGMSEDAEKWSATLQQSYAMSGAESKKYLSNLQDLLVPTGLARTEAGKLSNQFVKMAADLGSFNNLPTEKVIEDIQSALQGSSETMAKYGINVKAAKVEQEIYNMGLATSKAEITDAHKAQALYSIMMREGSDAVGDMARTSDSFANQQKKMTANLTDFATQVGQSLLPMATDVVTQVNEWHKANGKMLAQDIAGWIGKGINAFKATYNVVSELDTFFAYVIGNMLIGWEKFSFNFELLTLGLKSSFFLVFDSITEKMANVVDGMANKMAKLPFIGEDIAAGMKLAGDQYRNSSNAAEEFAAELEALQGKHANNLAVLVESQNVLSSREKKAIEVEENIQDAVETTTETRVTGDTVATESAEKAAKDLEKIQNKNDKALARAYQKNYKEKNKFSKLYTKDEQKSLKGLTDGWMTAQDKINFNSEKNLDEMSKDAKQYANDIKQVVGTEVSGFLVEEFGGIEGRWSGVWDSALSKLGEVATEMAVTWSASKVANLFDGWNFFHEGAWNLKDDEGPAILQMGEMVIPKGYADQIRDNLGSGFTGDFASLADSTRKNSPGQWETSTPIGKGVKESAFGTLKGLAAAGIVDLMGGSVNFKDIIGGGILDVSKGLMRGALDYGVTKATNADIFGQSMAEKFGGTLGGVLGVLGLGRYDPTGMMGSLASAAGSLIGNLVGDFTNSRNYEPARDRYEDGAVDIASIVDQMGRIDRLNEYNGPVGGLVGSFSSAWDGILDALGIGPTNIYTPSPERLAELGESNDRTVDGLFGDLDRWGRAATSKTNTYARGLLEAMGIDVASSNQRHQMERMQSTYGSKDGYGGLGGLGAGKGLGQEGDGLGSDQGTGERGGGNEGTSKAGGKGGYFRGGQVNGLMVPDGDDGIGGLRFEERVFTDIENRELMQMFREQKSNASGVSASLISALNSLQRTANSTLQILQRIERYGLQVKA